MQHLIRELEATIDQFGKELALIPADEIARKASPEKWSIKEIVGHLVDSAQNNIQRFVRAQYELNPHIIYNQVQWVSVQKYQHYPFESLIRLWAELNRHICFILAAIPQHNYALTCNTGTGEVAENHTLQELAEDYITHLLHHVKQIKP